MRRKRWRERIEQSVMEVAATGEPIVVSNRGKPLAVLVEYQEYLMMREALGDGWFPSRHRNG
jgi:prevent-host-death family protein